MSFGESMRILISISLEARSMKMQKRSYWILWTELEENELADFAKIFASALASADFSKELTTTAIWLRDKGVDIQACSLNAYNFKG